MHPVTQACPVLQTPSHTQGTETAEPGVCLGFPVLPFCSVSDGGASEQQNQTNSPEGQDKGREMQKWVKVKDLAHEEAVLAAKLNP